MPKVTEAHSEARREQILKAATRCFARKGVQRTTMREICTAARLSAGSVYTWFPSKKAIIQEMLRRRLQDFRKALELAPSDPRIAIRAYLDTVRQAAEDPAVGWLNIHLTSAAARDAFARTTMRQVTRDGGEVLEMAFRQLLKGDASEAAGRARLLQAAAFGIVVQSLLDSGNEASFDLVEQLLVP